MQNFVAEISTFGWSIDEWANQKCNQNLIKYLVLLYLWSKRDGVIWTEIRNSFQAKTEDQNDDAID